MAATRSVLRLFPLNTLHRPLHNPADPKPNKALLARFSDDFTKKWQGRLAQDTSDTVLKHRVSMFLELGLDEKNLESAVRRCPALLKQDFEQKLEDLALELNKLGIGKELIGRILLTYPPSILRIDAIILHLRLMEDFFSRYGLQKSALSRTVSTQPLSVLFLSENNIKRMDTFLEQYKISAQVLDKIVRIQPSFLGKSYETLAARIEFLSSIGIDQNSRYFVRALATYSSYGIETLKTVLDHLLNIGLPTESIYQLLQMRPQILCSNVQLVEEKLRYLTEDMKYPLDEILKFPVYFNVSLEKRVKPRNRVILFLQSKGVLRKRYALSTIITMTPERFVARFVELHPDAAAVYEGDDVQANLK